MGRLLQNTERSGTGELQETSSSGSAPTDGWRKLAYSVVPGNDVLIHRVWEDEGLLPLLQEGHLEASKPSDSDYLSDGTLRPAAPLKVCDDEIADRWLHQLVIVLRLWARYGVWSRLHLVFLTIQLCLTGAAELSFFDAA